jgi:hypothetical protein
MGRAAAWNQGLLAGGGGGVWIRVQEVGADVLGDEQ